ncbi:MAG: ACT domain protein [Deltaproteobacteria bacterium ADurb.Bin510]|nr:MAG: ACT domain protein [Deltaproteobacteria bacterium ADurb.Bin510]
MQVEQISIFLENKPGSLDAAIKLVAEAGVSIRALSLADTTDFGILRLIVNDVAAAKDALKAGGLTVGRTEVVAVEVPDQPGGLHAILSLLSASGVNVEYMYAFVARSAGNAVMIFRFDNIARAVEVLEKGGVTVLPGDKVYNL